jgi:ribonucleoside-diphosphate reductase beta chain
MSILEETIRQIEGEDVRSLAEVDIDDVYEYEDVIMRERKGPLDLYMLWEGLNWKVADLDFTEDKRHWETMFPYIKEDLFRTFTLFFIGEQAVTDTLSPLLNAAPTEDDRIFLSTQVVDEARHTVFFKKFFEEVLGVGGGLSGAFTQLKPGAVDGFKQIFDHQLVEAVDRCRLDPTDRVAWVKGITTYHLVIEGMLALTGQKFLLRTFRNMGMLPGFRAGFTAVARDESRHVNYGVGAIRDQIKQDPKMADEVAETVFYLLEPAVKIIEPADREYAPGIDHPNQLPPQIRINPREVYDFSLNSLAKRLRVAGLPDDVTEAVSKRGWEVYDSQIDLYEKKFNREHGIRYYDRGEVELV